MLAKNGCPFELAINWCPKSIVTILAYEKPKTVVLSSVHENLETVSFGLRVENEQTSQDRILNPVLILIIGM